MSAKGEVPATGILVMGYGSPEGPQDLPAFLREVMGREPPAAVVQEYERRYNLIGWSPQMRTLRSLREKVAARLERQGRGLPVYLATKHWTPHIAEVIPQAAADGVDRLTAIPVSPYPSPWILAPYQRGIQEGVKRATRPIDVHLKSGWHTNPSWLRYWSEAIIDALASGSSDTVVLLSAHSLPDRMHRLGDPYPSLVQETARRIATLASPRWWDFTYQSAGNATEPWLGPDITEKMVEWKERGLSEHLIAPIGFAFEHLEVLYDLDVVVKEFAAERGIRYRRVRMPDDDDRMVDALTELAFQADYTSASQAADAPGPVS